MRVRTKKLKAAIVVITMVLLWGTLPVLTVASDDDFEEFVEVKATRELLEKVQGGGYVLYLRHGKTDASRPDMVPIDLADCSTQRPLTDEGRKEIAAIGAAMRKMELPVGVVYSSPLCRALKSAKAAFGAGTGYGTVQPRQPPGIVTERNLMYTAHLTSAEKVPVVAKTRELLSKPVGDTAEENSIDGIESTNRVLVAHAPNLADVMDYFPEAEGTLVIFEPLGESGFRYLAGVRPEDWERLLGYGLMNLIDE